MTEVRVEAELGSAATEVWSLVSDFVGLIEALAAQFDAPVSITHEGEGIGSIRRIRLGDRLIVERLESFDDVTRRYSYSVLEGPYPIADYVASVEVDGLSADRCRVAWTGRFDAAGVPEDDAAAIMRDLYERTMAMLRGRFGT
jgi:hypothetical protein